MAKRKVHLENHYNRPDAVCGMKYYTGIRLTINDDSITCKACLGKAPPSELQICARKKFEALGAIAMAQSQLHHLQKLFPGYKLYREIEGLASYKAAVILWYEAKKKELQK